jgi:hypothetical protein
MLNIQKRLTKFQHYWFTDPEFRLKIYQSLYARKRAFTIYFFENLEREKMKKINSGYEDLTLISDEIWGFMVGLLFPERQIYLPAALDYNKLGKEMSLNGKWFKFWIWAIEKDFKGLALNDELRSVAGFSSIEIDLFWSAFDQRKELSALQSFQEKSIFLLAREAINPTIREAIKNMIWK